MSEEAVERGGPTFSPPLYMQRYVTVRDMLYNIPGVEKIADFGCAEGKFIKYLKNFSFATEISCIDLHRPSLDYACQVSRPAAWDFVFKRYKNLFIKIYCGSALEKDARLQGYDAVTCIELIEHLDQKDLVPLTNNVFSFIRPKVALFTTPNSEFNVLFPQVKAFRHWDHKFEWTRAQFAEWCDSVIKEYPDYTYEMQGIGEPPPESSSLGCCSQFAIFKLKETEKDPLTSDHSLEKPYQLIEKHLYPGRNENES